MAEEEAADCPGLKWRPRASGNPVPYWVARPSAVAAGYPVKSVNLRDLADSHALLATRCQRLQGEMLLWLETSAGGGTKLFDGTIGSLLEIYETHPDSTFRSLTPSSRHPYAFYLKKLKPMIGTRRVDLVNGIDVQRWHKTWREPDVEGGAEKLGAARMAVTVLKSALKFGAMLRLPGCLALRETLTVTDLPAPRPRTQAPTAAQIIAARKAAHELGKPSLALAYAFQFETVLRQWDVIGRWVELSDPTKSAVLGYGRKWVGLSWEHIDDRMILTITPNKTEETSGAVVVIDLTLCPMILEEMAHVPADKRSGPIIRDERTSLPYFGAVFRDWWRRDIRRLAGIPTNVWNRDLRAGGITEGRRGGAEIADSSKMAGHVRPQTTARVYDRDVLEASRRVSRKRVASRNDPGT